jgi:rRNA maturation protein Rpf1
VIGLTTRRETNQRLNSLIKELDISILNGKLSKEALARRLLEEGFTHAVILYRWLRGSGRLDFFNVNPRGMERVPPSILLKSVTLRREYKGQSTPKITAITYEEASKSTRRLGRVLSSVFELPISESHDLPCSLHLRDNGEVTEIVVRSLINMRDLPEACSIKTTLEYAGLTDAG